MTRQPLPPFLSAIISDRAAQFAREDIVSRAWRTSGAIQPFPGEGQVGLRTTVRHLMYQNQGTQPYIMWWVEGRRLPLGCARGDGPHFRTGVRPGTPGWVDIPHVGKRWRDQRWRHPGIKPKRFMQSAIAKAVRDQQPQIKQYLMRAISGEPI